MRIESRHSPRRVGTPLGISLLLAVSQFAFAQISYEKVARTGDPVPGRGSGIVFNGGAAEDFGVISKPAINDAGYVAFRGVSGTALDFTVDRAIGIYSSTLGLSPVRTVLADTTTAFEVPGRPGVRFTNFDPPIITEGSMVVFRGVFSGGAGFYAVPALGGAIIKLAESGVLGTPVPNTTGAPVGGATFNSGGFSGGVTAPMWLAATQSATNPTDHYFTFIAGFTDGTARTGIFAGTFTIGGSVTLRRVADDSATLFTDQGLSIGGINTEYPPAINASGTLIFGARVAFGLVRAVLTDSAAAPAMVTRARENQTSGTPFGNYGSTFDGWDINDAGRYLFHHRFNAGAQALFTNTLAGGSFRVVVDTSGAFPVPGRSATFTSLAIAAINEAGMLGFQAADNVVGVTNPQGLYRADAAACLSPSCVGLIANNSQVPPGQSPPSLFTRFENGGPGISAAINDNGNLAFAPIAILTPGDNLFGLYYYNTCTGAVERIVDKTVSNAVLPGGGTFGGSGTRGSRIYQGSEVRSGQYRALNDSDQLAFQVEFTPGDVGVYVATVASGPVVITCPLDAIVECGNDTSSISTGQPTATGCGTITILPPVDDPTEQSCVNNVVEVITRTWTATNGVSSDSCEQIITIRDTTPPSITVPIPATVACTASTEPLATGLASADDNCDPTPAIAYSDAVTAGACPAERTITRTWTATDACGNASSAVQVITVTSDVAPVLNVPVDVSISCSDSTAPAATGAATGSATCDPAPVIDYDDETAPGSCAGESIITRTWTITDACGNETSAVQLISVADTTGPVITLPADAGVGCGGSTDPTTTGSATATDACSGIASISHADVTVPGLCAASYTIQRTWTAVDTCGNPSSSVQLIVVSDAAAPVLTIPPAAFVECGDSTHPDFTGEATALDACSAIANLSSSDEETTGTCAGQTVRLIARTWSATDACGNTASQVQTITVRDTIAPVLTAPPAVTIACGDSTETALTGAATADDVCDPNPSIGFVDTTEVGECPTISVITRTWTATDACGNAASAVQLISIIDDEAPVLTCPPDVNVDLPPGQCEAASLEFGHATATDLCSESTVTNNAPAVFPVGATIVTWTATDACGNFVTCTQSVSVSDSQPPAICASVSRTMLWPPDHNLVNVGLVTQVSDACDSGIPPAVTVYANEDDETPTGDGMHSPDARDMATGTLRLRRERIGGGDGRVYLIVVSATDSSGNTATTCSTVVVPKNRSLAALLDVVLEAAYAQFYCHHHQTPPPGYVLVGDGAVIGPQQ